jgi:hypothetical protein
VNSALEWSRHDDSNNNRSGSSCSGSDDECSITVLLTSLLGRPVLKCRQYDDDIAQLTTVQHGTVLYYTIQYYHCVMCCLEVSLADKSMMSMAELNRISSRISDITTTLLRHLCS